MSEPLGQHGDWEFARLSLREPIDTPVAVAAVVKELKVPAIGAFVADSDAAAIYFDEPKGVSGHLAINRSYEDSDEELTRLWLDPDKRRSAAEALAAWAEAGTGAKVSADAILGALADLEEDFEGERSILMAEDGLRAIFQGILGFPDLDRAVFMAGNR